MHNGRAAGDSSAAAQNLGQKQAYVPAVATTAYSCQSCWGATSNSMCYDITAHCGSYPHAGSASTSNAPLHQSTNNACAGTDRLSPATSAQAQALRARTPWHTTHECSSCFGQALCSPQPKTYSCFDWQQYLLGKRTNSALSKHSNHRPTRFTQREACKCSLTLPCACSTLIKCVYAAMFDQVDHTESLHTHDVTHTLLQPSRTRKK